MSNLSNLNNVFDLIESLHAASSSFEDPGQSLASSLVWSMAGRASNLMVTLEMTKSPERIAQYDASVDETLAVLSQLSAVANPELMPEPEQFLAQQDNAELGADARAEMAELLGISGAELEPYLEEAERQEAAVQEMRREIIESRGKEIALRLKQAMEVVEPIHDDISNNLTLTLLQKMEGKLTQTHQKRLARLSTMLKKRGTRSNDRVELAGQCRLIKGVKDNVTREVARLESIAEERPEPM